MSDRHRARLQTPFPGRPRVLAWGSRGASTLRRAFLSQVDAELATRITCPPETCSCCSCSRPPFSCEFSFDSCTAATMPRIRLIAQTMATTQAMNVTAFLVCFEASRVSRVWSRISRRYVSSADGCPGVASASGSPGDPSTDLTTVRALRRGVRPAHIAGERLLPCLLAPPVAGAACCPLVLAK